jgi:FtsZ-binding cell division protein ZapB
METKILVFIVIGLVVGSGLGYMGNIIVTEPKINALNQKITNLETNVTSLNEKNNALTGQYSNLQNEHQNLEKTYSTLQSSYNGLNSQYTALNQQNNQLKTNYDALLTSYQKLLAAVPMVPEAFTGKATVKTCSWTYGGQSWSISLSIPYSLYDYYKKMPRAPTSDYSVYVTHPYDDEYMRTIIEKFNIIAITKGYSEAEKVNLVVAFIQSLPYTSDEVTTGFDEYPRYPIETLYDDGGDCEDTSIIAAALLHTMNYDIVLLSLPGHMAVGVYLPGTYGSYYQNNGKNYFYLETTGEGWKIGQLPNEFKGVGAYLYELKAIPVLTHEWTAKWLGGNLVLNVTVTNVGSATANGYFVEAGLDAGGDKWRDVKSSDPFDLAIGKKVSIILTLTPSKGYYTRLIVEIVHPDGYHVDESFSDWFST